MICTQFSPQWQAAVDQLFASIFDPTEIPYYVKTVIDGSSLVAVDDGELVGFLLLTHTPNDVCEYQLAYLAVDERYRQQGVASAMLEALPHRVWLEVLSSNTTACDFYLKRGFTIHESFTCSDGTGGHVFISPQ